MDNLDKEMERISNEYYNEIYKFCLRRVQNENDAYDITQNVFFALINAYKNINPDNVQQWLYNTARHKIADYFILKKKIREHEVSLQKYEVEESEELSGSTEDDISDEQIEELKHKILSELSKEDSELYKDFYVKKMSYHMLAVKYNVSKTAMYKRISRLKITLKSIKKKYF